MKKIFMFFTLFFSPLFSFYINDEASFDNLSIKQINIGLTNKIFLISFDGSQKYILRIGNPNRNLLGIDRIKEIDNCKNFSCGFFVEILFYDETNDILLTSFFDGKSIEPKKILEDEKKLQTFINAIRNIHQQPILKNIKNEDLYPVKINKFYLKSLEDILPEFNLEEEKEFLNFVINNEINNLNPCICHNDLVWTNLLWKDNDLKIIDWEYSDFSDCYFDLAGFCIEQNFDEEMIQKILLNYFQNIPISYKKFYLMCALYSLKNYLWALIFESCTEDNKHKDLLNNLNIENKNQFVKFKTIYELL